MNPKVSRRSFIQTSIVSAGTLSTMGVQELHPLPVEAQNNTPLKLGLMTYTLGKDWDIETLIKNLQETQWEHAELRTTHAHGVEVSLSKSQRRDVRRRFENAGIQLSLASAFAFHWPDQQKLKQHIEGAKEYSILAHDIGAIGIRVFPNAILVNQGIPEEQTLEQIGKALNEVATFAHDLGVEIRVSNHGKGTNRVSRIKKIIDYSDCKHLYMNWNCDRTDVEDPGFEANFNLVKDRIRNLHIHDLTNEAYPYRTLFSLLKKAGYQGYCDAEVGQSCEPIKFMQYYRALFLALQNAL